MTTTRNTSEIRSSREAWSTYFADVFAGKDVYTFMCTAQSLESLNHLPAPLLQSLTLTLGGERDDDVPLDPLHGVAPKKLIDLTLANIDIPWNTGYPSRTSLPFHRRFSNRAVV